jgi:hypothetical protein
LGEDKVALIDSLRVYTLVPDAIASTVNTLRLVLHNLGYGISFAEVDRHGTDALRFG